MNTRKRLSVRAILVHWGDYLRSIEDPPSEVRLIEDNNSDKMSRGWVRLRAVDRWKERSARDFGARGRPRKRCAYTRRFEAAMAAKWVGLN